MDMELADPRLIAQLREASAAQQSPPAAVRRKIKSAASVDYQAPRRLRRRCVCGTCAPCRENQRWEAIFDAKFADPDYYSGLTVRHQSSLHLI